MLWYDLETFGRHPRWDRIAQYASLRTGADFEEIGEPTSVYCLVTPDYLPDPDACLITALTPQRVKAHGVSEAQLAELVYRQMIQPGTCVAGYNNIRFDDEFVRNLFYRNFYDPFRREYSDGNSRWDILDLVRMTHDLRPDGIEWLYDEQGRPVFQLEQLSAANGIESRRAHDALSDVRATVGLARLVHQKQPKLFRFLYGLRRKEAVRKLLNLQSPRPVVHSSAMFTRPGGCTSLVYPLSTHPSQPNVIICYDLRFDPRDWMDLPVEEIRRRVFTRTEELGPEERVHFKGVHLNRSPALAPLATLSDERAAALNLDPASCRQNAEVLRSRPELLRKVREVYTEDGFVEPRDPELQIYSGGFFGDEDRRTFQQIHASEPAELVSSPPAFVDPRGAELLRRYLARNHFAALPKAEQDRWVSHCASRLLAPEIDGVTDYGKFRRKVENSLARTDTPAAHKPILRELLEYADWIERNVLSYR